MLNIKSEMRINMKKILVVDDNKEIRQLVSATLENDDYNVSVASDAKEALQMCVDTRPDLVIMDVRMPGEIDGIEATRMLKTNAATSQCAVIMLSGLGGNKEVEKARNAGAIDYLLKPFSPLELIEKVEQGLKLNN